MCCSDPPPPPDLGPAAQASTDVARMQQQTAREQLAWAREQDSRNQEVLQQVLDIQLPAMQAQFDQAQGDRERYNTIFKPMEDAFVEEAQNYDTPERRAEQRAKGIADVNTQFDAARRNSLQRLESYGVDPSQTRNAALDIGTRTAQAAAQVGAATRADNRVEDTGRALRSDAINLGRGALSNAAGFYGQAVGAGSAGVGNANQTTGAGAGALQSGLGFSGQALQGYGQSANIMGQGYGMEMDRYNAQNAQTAGLLQGIGGIAGAAMAMADGGMAIDPNVIEGEFTDVTADVNGPGDGSGIDDQVPAMLSSGEYVIPADVVTAKGEEFFDKLLEKYHVPAEEQRAR
jgi:hypothetical protein